MTNAITLPSNGKVTNGGGVIIRKDCTTAKICAEVRNIMQESEQGFEQEKNQLYLNESTTDIMVTKTAPRNPYKVTKNGEHQHVAMEDNVKEKIDINFAKDWKTDAEWIGSKMKKKKNKNATRIWLQNPNGIQAANDFRQLRGDLSEASDMNIDFLAIPETKLNYKNTFVRDRMNTLIEYHYPQAKICFTNTPKFSKEVCHQPGGAGSIASGDLAGRYAGMGSDACGRYTWMKFSGTKRSFKIYTVYRVSQSSGTNLGDTTAFVQQFNFLNTIKKSNKCEKKDLRGKQRETKHKIINPRDDVLKNLMAALSKDARDGILFIVMGDMNENIFTTKFNDMIETIGGQNVMKQRFQNEVARTYNRGKQIIDGVWMSSQLMSTIQNVGLAPFQELFNSDHRGIYMDLDLRDILDAPHVDFQNVKNRRLQASIPRRTEAYINKMELHWKYHYMNEKIHNLRTALKTGDVNEENLEKQLNAIDKQIGEIMASSEKTCTKVNKNSICEWSPKLGEAIKKERKLKKELTTMKRCGLIENVQERKNTLHQIVLKLKDVRMQIRDIKKNDKEMRKEHLEELIHENIEKSSNRNYAGELKRLKNVEKQRDSARRIRKTSEIPRKQGVNRILIPAVSQYTEENERNNHHDTKVIWRRLQEFNGKDITEWEEINEKNKVEQMTLEIMKLHFGQAQESPLTTTEWSQQLMDTTFLEKIENENFEDLQNESIAIQEYFRAMTKNKAKTKLQPFEYTLDDWKWHIRKVKEKTTTSPAGRHYGHFKVLLEKAPKIFEAIYDIMHMAFANNIVLQRWKKTVTVVIPKDEGIPKLHRLRPLHLVEPEINALAKALWSRKLMKIADKEKLMTDDQYGGRKNRQAQSAILNKVLYYDINRMSMCECQYDDIDMKSNYDRELARLVTAEASIKLGMHRNDANFMVDFVENQEYYIKTAFGTTENHYKFTENEKLYGLGQGIAWAGPGWLISSDTIATCKKGTCSGMLFQSPISDLKVLKWQDMFVDDTACGCNTTKKKECTIMEQAQENCQKHSDYVEVTGGLVAADKSHYYHVDWEFVNGLQVPIIDTDQRSQIFLHQGDGICREIKKMPITREHKTLGCWVNPLGKKEKALQQMEQFAKKWRDRMINSGLAPNLIRQSYETELKSQLRYRLPVYQFTETECDDLMKIISPVMLNAFYANKKYPRSLMQANDQYAGMGIEHIYDTMGIEKSKFMFMHLRRMDTTGKLIVIAMQKAQLECGSETLFFNLDYEQWEKLVTPTWQTNLWEYYSKRRIKVDLDLNIVTRQIRIGDAFIMDILTQSNKFSDIELSQVNKVRQHMQLLTLSDVTNVQGNRILHNIRKCINYRRSKYEFAPQDPLQAWKKLWTEKVCPVLNRYVNRKPLGKWKKGGHQIFDCFYDSEKEILVWKEEKYRKITSRYEKMEIGHDECMSLNCDRIVDVGIGKNGKPIIVKDCERDQMYETLEGAIDNSFQKYAEHWGNIEQCEPDTELQRALTNGKVLVATDGSNKNDEGAQGWLVTNENGKNLVRGRGRVACAKEDASSLRPELAAILAAVSYLSWFVEEKNISLEKTKKVKLYTDSENSILDLRQSLFPTTKNVFENNIDMKLETKQALRTSPLKFDLIHVAAHQDEKVPFDELPLPAQLNCLVDEYVGGTYEESEYSAQYHLVPFLKSQICSLSLPFRRPTSHVREQLVSFANGHKAEKQLSTYWNMQPEWQCNIEWRGLRTAIRREVGTNKTRLSKLIHKQLPTMQMMKRNGFSLSDICPLCEKEIEDWNHVIRCTCNNSSIERMEKLADVKKMLISYRTEPVLQQRLLAMMQQWIGQYEYKIPEGDVQLQTLNAAFRDQNILGIENIFVGVISHKFGEYQQEHYDKLPEKQRKLNQKEWNVAFIRALLQFSGHMWMERCNYLHNISNMTMEKQMRIMAWKMKEMLVENKWKLRAADRHILKRSRKFFRKAPTQALQGWIERAKVSIDIEFNHEQATRQNITKWITVNGKNMQEPKCKENTFKTTSITKKKCVQSTLHQAFKSTEVGNTLLMHETNKDVLSDWDDIRPQCEFDEYEVESHSQSEDMNSNSEHKNDNDQAHEYGIPNIIIIGKSKKGAATSTIHGNSEITENNGVNINISNPRREEDRCTKQGKIGRATRSNWFREKIQKMKHATLKYGLGKTSTLSTFKSVPAKMKKMSNWYINRINKNKGNEETSASDEEIIFAEDQSGWESSDSSKVAEEGWKKRFPVRDVQPKETRSENSDCVKKRIAGDELNGTIGGIESMSFENIEGTDLSSYVNEQQSNMSLSQYMKTCRKKPTKLIKLLQTNNSDSFPNWSEESDGTEGKRCARWESGRMNRKEHHQNRTCNKLVQWRGHQRSDKVRNLLRDDSSNESVCSELTNQSEKFVLVEEIEIEDDKMQEPTNKHAKIKLKGHHLVCDSHHMRPKQNIRCMDLFNHIREGSIQIQAVHQTKAPMRDELKEMFKQNRNRRQDVTKETRNKQASKTSTQGSKQLQRRFQTVLIRTKHANGEEQKSEHLSHTQNMEGGKNLTRESCERKQILPPIRTQNGWIDQNLDLIRHSNISKFSTFNISKQEEDLQRGMTSGVKIKLDREKMECDATEKNDHECMNRDDARCPTTYPIVCPINYFVCLNKKNDQS